MANAPKRPGTYEDYVRLLEAGRAVEWIGGEIVEKAMPSPEHGSAQGTLLGLLGPFNGRVGGPRGPGGWWLMTEVDVRYVRSAEAFRHDAIGFRRDEHPQRPRGMPLEVVPHWVCEILSTSTARIDLVRKQRVLHAEQVPYYWIVDPEREVLIVLRWASDAYQQILTAEIGETVRAEPFEQIELSIAELFGRDDASS